MLRFYIVCTLASIMAACAGNDEARSLRYLQHLADEERYAEVLDSIRKIDRCNIRSERLAARYGLLYAQALGKNDIYIGNDSLIDPAVEYYRRKGDDRQCCLSWFYKGSGLAATNDHASAAVCYLQAETYARMLGDDYCLGLIYSYLGSSYNAQCLRERAIEYLQLAAEHYRKAGKEQNLNWTYGALGDAYFGFADYGTSSYYYRKAVRLAEERGDETMLYSNLKNLLFLYSKLHKMDSARVIYDNLAREALFGEKDYCKYVYLMESAICDKKYDSADRYIDTLDMFFPVYGRIQSYFDKSLVYGASGDYQSAYASLSKYERLSDSAVRAMLKKNVTDAEAGFHRERAEYNAYRLKVSRAVDRAVIALIVLLFAAAAIALWYLYRKRMRDRERFMAIVDELRSSRDILGDRLAATSRNKQRLSELLREQFQPIDDLMRSYYEHADDRKKQSAVYNRVKRMIERFSVDRRTMAMFDEIIDSTRDDLMSELKREYPNINGKNLCLLRYIFMELSPQSISILVGDTVDNIYTRKSRLKNRFLLSDSPSRMRFVDAL